MKSPGLDFTQGSLAKEAARNGRLGGVNRYITTEKHFQTSEAKVWSPFVRPSKPPCAGTVDAHFLPSGLDVTASCERRERGQDL